MATTAFSSAAKAGQLSGNATLRRTSVGRGKAWPVAVLQTPSRNVPRPACATTGSNGLPVAPWRPGLAKNSGTPCLRGPRGHGDAGALRHPCLVDHNLRPSVEAEAIWRGRHLAIWRAWHRQALGLCVATPRGNYTIVNPWGELAIAGHRREF